MANTTDTMTPEEILRGIIDGSLTELEDDGVTAIGARKFNGRTALTRVSFPNFNGGIGDYAFNGCTNLTTVEAAGATSLGMYAFNGCTNLTTVDVSNITSIAQYAFKGTAVKTLHLKKATSPASYILSGSSVECFVNEGRFNGNAYSVFDGASHVKIIDMNWSGTAWSTKQFANCSNLKKIIRRGTDVNIMSNTGPLGGTPFASGGSGGTFYVNKNKIANFKAASNWATYLNYAKNMILPIQGSIYETQYADGIPVNGATASDPEYCIEKWTVVSSSNGDIPYIQKDSSANFAMGLSLRGTYPVRLAAVDGGDSAIYPIEIPSGNTSVTFASSTMDFMVIEMKRDNDEWVQTAKSSWILQSGGDSHSYSFTGTGTTHFMLMLRQAGTDTGTVTQAMCDSVTFTWNN